MSGWVTVARSGEIPMGEVRVAEACGVRIAVCHTAGGFYAVEDRCTHDDGPLGEGALDGDEIECPRHGARFDVKTGAVTCLPAVVPVRTYALRIVGDEIQIHVPE